MNKNALPAIRLCLFLVALAVAAVLLVPYSALDRIQTAQPWIGRSVLWLDTRVPGFDLDHLVAFAALGLLMSLARLKAGFRLALTCFVAAAALTELGQLLLPGRSPQLADAAMDVLGGTLGYALGHLLVVAMVKSPRRLARD